MNFISEQELKKYGKTFSLSMQAVALVNQQEATWELVSANYRSLKEIQTRSFNFGHFRVDCQYNPGRIRSSSADTSEEVILSRPCFLCAENRPPEQAGISYRDEFTILVNPYPIFPCHLTIPSNQHIPQQISGNAGSLLQLGYDLSDFTVFYNGPRCGASAPDHFHFQAGLKESLPIEEELESLLINHAEVLAENDRIKIVAVEDYLRRFICFRSPEKELLVNHICNVISFLPGSENEEPMMNILVWYQQLYWNVILFPRAMQRPRQYYTDDFDRLIISPAIVEMGGLVILPREEDFDKLTGQDLTSVFNQVTLQKREFAALKQKIAENSAI